MEEYGEVTSPNGGIAADPGKGFMELYYSPDSAAHRPVSSFDFGIIKI